MELANQPVLCNATNGNLMHILKDPEVCDQELRHLIDNYQDESQKSKLGNLARVDSGSTYKTKDTGGSSVSVLNGDYCGLATQLSIEYVDIFEILRAEVLAAEAGEFEVIENELLNNDTRDAEAESEENGKQFTSTNVHVVDRYEVKDSFENSVVGESPEDSRQTNGLFSSNHDSSLMQAKSNEGNGQVHLVEYDKKDLNPSGNGESGDRDRCLQYVGGKGGIPSDNSKGGDRCLQIVDQKGANPSDNGKGGEDGCLQIVDQKGANPSDNGKGGEDGCLQNMEGKGADSFKVASSEVKTGTSQLGELMSEEKSGTGEDHDRSDRVGSSNILIVEVIGDAYSRGVDGINFGKGNVHPTDYSKSEDGDVLLESDKYSENSEDDEEHVASRFSGPIAFSGMLTYSGLISYSGQIPYSGNLSLHSDSSTSTRSFAFPVLAADWNSSPSKIGPPDSRYFRRRRRWRPCFCCRRPTTLFD